MDRSSRRATEQLTTRQPADADTNVGPAGAAESRKSGARSAALCRIGDAARLLGMSPATLRLWEQQGLIRPGRTPGGSRAYSEDDLALLRKIQHLRRVEHLSPRASVRLLRHEAGTATATSASALATPVPAPASAPVPSVPVAAASTVAPDLGDRLRARRKSAGLTLRQAAEQTGMSISFLSAVERGITGVSLARLHALVKLYGLTVQELLDDDTTAGRLVRAAERPRMPTSNPGIRIQLLARGRPEMEPHYYIVEPGAGSDGAYDHVGEELIFLLSGSLEVWLDEREHYTMAPGDCLYFPSTLPHRWQNTSQERTELIWVNTPPTF